MRKQYAEYVVVDDIHINSKLTSGEDVADLGGTLLAYLAWKKSTVGRSQPAVDGLTPDQRFFVGMAQWACGDERPEQKRQGAITDPHSPNQYRINGVVSNLPEFGQAFSCKIGTADDACECLPSLVTVDRSDASRGVRRMLDLMYFSS